MGRQTITLSDALQQYLSSRRSNGTKESTLRNESRVLRYLLADIGNIQVDNLRAQHMDVYWTRRTTWGPNTANTARYVLGTFFKWCQVRGYLARDNNPLEGTKKRTVPERQRVIIPQGEFATFLDGARTPRTRIILATSLYLFTRISETASLRWQDIDELEVHVFREKTSTLDVLPLCVELAVELRRWRLAYSAFIGRQLLPSDFVIPFLKAARMTGIPGQRGGWQPVEGERESWNPTKRPHLGYVIQQELERAGYYQPYEGGHTLRRSGAVALYQSLSARGHDKAIRICQAMLGHKNITTTEIYLQLSIDRKERNVLLAGKPMFPVKAEATVVQFPNVSQSSEGVIQ